MPPVRPVVFSLACLSEGGFCRKERMVKGRNVPDFPAKLYMAILSAGYLSASLVDLHSQDGKRDE